MGSTSSHPRLGRSILSASKIRFTDPVSKSVKTRPLPVATAPAQPPRGSPRLPTIVISAPSPPPHQTPQYPFSTQNPWDKQYPNKAGALIECSFRPSSPCIERPSQIRARLQLGTRKLTTSPSGQQKFQDIWAYFASMGPALEYLGPPDGPMEGIVLGMDTRVPKHTRSDAAGAARPSKRQMTASGRAAATAVDTSRDEEIARGLQEEQEWGRCEEAGDEALARRVQGG